MPSKTVEETGAVARPKIADYAAVAIAPVLIFVMISSLANYFLMLFSDGGYSDRAWYLISMYTMGAVALARIVIENDRSYSAGYAIALGGAMVFVMSRFTVGGLPFAVFIVVLIGYLADRIVHDCTLIDYTVDASGEGLVDRAMDEANGVRKDDRDPEAPETEKARRRRKSHQPGRTVFLLALAAFPLFGLGQFMLGQGQAWSRAQLMLGLYLFSSLSLLVTTSFLNLRRYLRQRDVDMPANVTVAWLAGGILMIAALMMMAYLAPLPGQALASFQAPTLLETREQMASAFGWGNEAAEKSDSESDAQTSGDDNARDKQQRGAGDNENEPSGETGGKKPSDKSAGSEKGKQSDSGSPSESKGKSDSSQQSQSDNANSKSENGKQQQTGANSKENPESQQDASSKQGEQQSGDQAQDGSQKDQSQDSESNSSEKQSGDDSQSSQDSDSNDSDSRDGSNDSDQQDNNQGGSEQQQPGESNSQSQQQSQKQDSESSSNFLAAIGSLFSALGSLLRFLLIIGLIALVGYYLYRMRDQILAWWQSLFAGRERSGNDLESNAPGLDTSAPPKPFAAYRNPIGKENDRRRIIVQTCQAFDAWARERGVPRSQDETPSAYIERLRSVRLPGNVSSVVSPVESSCVRVGNAYDRVVYGRGGANEQDVKAAAELWAFMSSARQTPVTA